MSRASTATPATDSMIHSDHVPDRSAHFADTDSCVSGPIPGFSFRGPDFVPEYRGSQEPRQGDYAGSLNHGGPIRHSGGVEAYAAAKAEALAMGAEHVATMEPKQWVVTVTRTQTVQIVVDAFSYQEADYYGVRTEIPEDAWHADVHKAGFQSFAPETIMPVTIIGDGILARPL